MRKKSYLNDEFNLIEYVSAEDYFFLGKRTTVCLLTLNNGFEIVASSACLGSEKFCEATGKAIAKELALQKLYEYLVIKKGLTDG